MPSCTRGVGGVVVSAFVMLAGADALAQGVQSLWASNCMNCHGDRGQGGGAGTRTLLDDRFGVEGGGGGGSGAGMRYDRLFFDAIKLGQEEQGMPAFGQTLSDPQIWALVNYIRELQAVDRRRRVGSPREADGVYRTARHAYRIETVVDRGLEVPWSVEFLPDGRMLVSDRPGRLRIHSTGRPGGRLSDPVRGTPPVRNQGQGGLMDIALHPEYASNGWVYLSYAEPLDEPGGRNRGMTTIVRGKIALPASASGAGTPEWVEQQTIFRANPDHFVTGDVHFGCRIVFDPRDSSILYFAIGERGRMEMAQDLSRPNGKIHRVHDDGRIPADNPFVGVTDAYESIWTFGNRNPQGLVFDLDGRLWDTEHAPRGGDEINLIEKGRNYGWPIVSFGINYNGAPFVTPWPDTAGPAAAGKDIAMPADRWLPSIGACGLDVSPGGAFPDWRGDLLAGGLSGANIDRVRLRDGTLVEREEIFHGHGRVRDVRCAPDGTVYVVLNDPDKVVRLVPADAP